MCISRRSRGADETGWNITKWPIRCYYVTGAADFVLVLTADDMVDYEDFTRRHLFGRNVRRFETMAVMDRVKVGTAIPMAERQRGR